MQLFKLKEFSRRARKERVTDEDLRDAVARAERVRSRERSASS
jgi:hypothetical protein